MLTTGVTCGVAQPTRSKQLTNLEVMKVAYHTEFGADDAGIERRLRAIQQHRSAATGRALVTTFRFVPVMPWLSRSDVSQRIFRGGTTTFATSSPITSAPASVNMSTAWLAPCV